MDLSYSAEYVQFRDEIRAFLNEQWTDADRNSSPPADGTAALMGAVVRHDDRATEFRLAAIARGYLYRHVPRAYGGSEQPYDPLKSTIIAEEFRHAKAPGDGVPPRRDRARLSLPPRAARLRRQRTAVRSAEEHDHCRGVPPRQSAGRRSSASPRSRAAISTATCRAPTAAANSRTIR